MAAAGESNSGCSGGGGSLRQYYVAVSTPESKVHTLVELLRALRPAGAVPLAAAVAVASRDALDAAAHALDAAGGFNVALLVSVMCLIGLLYAFGHYCGMHTPYLAHKRHTCCVDTPCRCSMQTCSHMSLSRSCWRSDATCSQEAVIMLSWFIQNSRWC